MVVAFYWLFQFGYNFQSCPLSNDKFVKWNVSGAFRGICCYKIWGNFHFKQRVELEGRHHVPSYDKVITSNKIVFCWEKSEECLPETNSNGSVWAMSLAQRSRERGRDGACRALKKYKAPGMWCLWPMPITTFLFAFLPDLLSMRPTITKGTWCNRESQVDTLKEKVFCGSVCS